MIVNYSGVGDGIVEFPYLKSMEQTVQGLNYYHTSGLLFKHQAFMELANLRACRGLIPEEWRKFRSGDWGAILDFLELHRINIILNLRINGPDYNQEYVNFKMRFQDRIDFWDFTLGIAPFDVGSIRQRMTALFRSKNAINDPFNRHALGEIVPRTLPTIRRRIGISIHSGSHFKLWPMEKWRALCLNLAAQGFTITVFAGYTDQEKSTSFCLVNELNDVIPNSATLFYAHDIVDILNYFPCIECLVSTDSWMVHAATATRINVVGLYVVTSSKVWGGDDGYSWPVESHHLASCENFDPHLGICRNHYTACRLLRDGGDGIEVEDVLARFVQAQQSKNANRISE